MIFTIGVVGFFLLKCLTFDSHFSNKTIDNIKTTDNLPTLDALGYQSEYAVVPANTEINSDAFTNDTYAALLVDNTDKKAIIAHNAFRRIYPASTTKLMTALVVLKAVDDGKISLDDVVTLSSTTDISDPDAVKSNLTAGCSISVRNLLYGLLIKSYNDYAVILANYVGGNEQTFVDSMNAEAASLGATGCHFVNPNGLHDDNHYITAYDMYIIINAVSKYDIIHEIDSKSSFTYTYKDANGNEQTDDITPTNLFLDVNDSLPSNIEIEAWKTGTTSLAGNVLTMNVNIDGKNYTLFAADSISPKDLYSCYSRMFNMTE